MLNTYMKKQGVTQTIVHDNDHNHFNQVNWDADYDGNTANISVNSNTDGKRDRFNISLDNKDLANILNIPSVNMPIHKRLKMDFQKPSYKPEHPHHYFVELSTPRLLTPRILTPELEPKKPKILEEIINSGITSPATNEEFIVPLTIDKKTIDDFILTPRKKHRRRKTHVTHKIYKKLKSKSKSTSTSKSKTRSTRKRV